MITHSYTYRVCVDGHGSVKSGIIEVTRSLHLTVGYIIRRNNGFDTE